MDAKLTLSATSLSTFLHADTGTLRLIEWAEDKGVYAGKQVLEIDTGARSTPMAHSSATGDGLVSNGQLGVDAIRVAAGHGFQPHTHPGDHLLIVVAGEGTITYDGRIYATRAGQVYMIEGSVPHAVGAITDHVILAVGSPHKPVDALDRMAPVEYREVTAELGELTCLICDLTAYAPTTLAELGCPHCPTRFIPA